MTHTPHRSTRAHWLSLMLCLALSAQAPSRAADSPFATGVAPGNALQCALDDPRQAVGRGRDAPSAARPAVAVTPARRGVNSGACQGNQAFRLGSAVVDITGPAAGSVMMGYESPTHVSSGIHLRQYARAFVVESPCNQQRVAFVSADLGMIFHSVRQGVLNRLAQDPILSAHFDGQNVMLSATHTHAGPGGYSHHLAFNLFRAGYDDLTYQGIVDGIYQSIQQAHANLERHPEPGQVRLGVGDVLNANVNRSPQAYLQNIGSERQRYLDVKGQPQDVEKSMTLLRLNRPNGQSIGVINWFGVHPISTGNTNLLISSDNKGWASLQFERMAGTRYNDRSGHDNFVAAFAQSNEGDSSPNIFLFERPFAERGGSTDEFESNAISGSKQLATALRLFNEAKRTVTGGVSHALFHVAFDRLTVTDRVVLSTLQHPATLDSPVKRTCTAAMGVSFGAGAEDGPGPTVEGVSCADPLNAQRVAQDVMALQKGKIPPHVLASGALCNVKAAPNAVVDLSCHAEKPVLFVLGPPLNLANNILPLQIFTIGNVAIVGIPWEVTTMAGRRIRDTVQTALKRNGVDTVVIAGLSNDYVSYLTTREEYASQQYEGGSNQFGPWTLAALQQELRRLAVTMAAGALPPPGPPAATGPVPLPKPPYIAADASGGQAFGQALTRPGAAGPGQAVTVTFQSAHPRNQTERGRPFALLERLGQDGRWSVVHQDRDGELLFRWKPADQALYSTPVPFAGGASQADITWNIPRHVAAGTYRLRHQGVAVVAGQSQAFSGASEPFKVAAGGAMCAY